MQRKCHLQVKWKFLFFSNSLAIRNNNGKWPFFPLGNLLLISQYFLREKGQYVSIVSVLVIVGLIVYDSGTLSPSKKIPRFSPFGEGSFPKELSRHCRLRRGDKTLKHFSCNPEYLVLQAVRRRWVCWKPGDSGELPGNFISASPLPCLMLGFQRSHRYLTGLEELRVGQDLVRGRLK